jgi:predicted enzyme related to lactoylglutathione lyase
MKIKVTSVYVDDQDKALRFYTEVLGFAKKADFSQGPYRWLTVASPEEPDGTELQLALNNNPAAKAYQQAMFQQGQPAAMFFTDDVKGDYERIKARGAEFTMPPTDVTGLDHCDAERHLRQPHSAHPAGTLFRAAEKKMTDREQYTPGPASGAQVRKDGEKWTLILVRELRHSPEKVWQALTDPAHLREWAPFDADGSLGTVGTTVKLTTVGTPTPQVTETT